MFARQHRESRIRSVATVVVAVLTVRAQLPIRVTVATTVTVAITVVVKGSCTVTVTVTVAFTATVYANTVTITITVTITATVTGTDTSRSGTTKIGQKVHLQATQVQIDRVDLIGQTSSVRTKHVFSRASRIYLRTITPGYKRHLVGSIDRVLASWRALKPRPVRRVFDGV